MEQIFRPEIVPGDRIFFSHPQQEDLPTLARWFADLEITLYIGQSGHSYTLADERNWLETYTKEPNAKHFAIIVRESGAYIGTASLMKIDSMNGQAEFGIVIGEKSAWNQGYGSEAARLMCEYGFTFLNLYNIRLLHVGFNDRGHRAYLKAGFREVGRLRGARVFNGQRYDDVLMDITRDDFGPTTLARLVGQLATENTENTKGKIKQ